MGDHSHDKMPGCGLLNVVLGRNPFWSRRNTSISTFSTSNRISSSRRRRGGSDETAFLDSTSNSSEYPPRSTTGHSPMINQKISMASPPQSEAAVIPVNAAGGAGPRPSPKVYMDQGKRVPKEAVGISGELESMISDHQKVKGSSTLVRASSGNVMLHGNLGNLRQPGGKNTNKGGSNNILDHSQQRGYGYGSNKTSEAVAAPVPLCRAISTRMDPETLKIMGNEDYKNGRFAEALALYDAAISIDPNKASYRSNKSAALTALGRILDAVFECREAIRIDPHYQRAHNRIATLYIRLGEAEKAIYHYKHAGSEANPSDIAKAKILQTLLQRCTEARKVRDWNCLIKESSQAISGGADSAPQIFSLKAEALIKLQRHQEADETLLSGPNFEVVACTKFLGPVGNANLLTVQAQVDMAAGRFDRAVEAAQRAARLDPNSREASYVMEKARAVALARSKGNELFKAVRFSEASMAYGEGLEHDNYNSVLLCNRAACRMKLDQFNKAIKDCNMALKVRPSYRKARLRRADCNAKLGRWDASVQDYEVLITETPDDEEVARALSEARQKLELQRGRS
ncbi:hypothetical protein SAY86_002298 [Trapa natans]|uniref:Inactive TPR repeat-containing thioredoxin TTL3-like n=1 Tax=Trapa natans TaxID=22666 RepID=A0AAN7LK07_TRANT|nr:hypothetical protein SAY86_002298 [Trapa natans]